MDETIDTGSAVGARLERITETDSVSYLMFNNSKVKLVAKILIGRSVDNDIVIDSKLASRRHALIQKIKDDYFIKDVNSTNGTFVNGKKIPAEKYVKLTAGDIITIGNVNLAIS